jgi:RHS repeat-associated protein
MFEKLSRRPLRIQGSIALCFWLLASSVLGPAEAAPRRDRAYDEQAPRVAFDGSGEVSRSSSGTPSEAVTSAAPTAPHPAQGAQESGVSAEIRDAAPVQREASQPAPAANPAGRAVAVGPGGADRAQVFTVQPESNLELANRADREALGLERSLTASALPTSSTARAHVTAPSVASVGAIAAPKGGIQRGSPPHRGASIEVRPPADPAALVKAFPNEYGAPAPLARAALTGAARLDVHPEILWFAETSAGLHPAMQTLAVRSATGQPVRFTLEAEAGIELDRKAGSAGPQVAAIRVSLRGMAPAERRAIIVQSSDLPGERRQVEVRVTRAVPGASDAAPPVLRSLDSAGRLLRLIQPDGVVLDFRYDGGGRLLAESSSDGYRVSFTYDSAGRRATMTDSRGTTTYRYDAQGRLVELDPPATHGFTPPAPLCYRYDREGRLIQLSYPDGHQVSYEWDATGRLVAAGGARYDYDPASGRLRREALPCGLIADYRDDAAGRSTDLVYRLADGGDLPASHDPRLLAIHTALTPSGLPAAVTRESQGGTETTTYRWDAAGRLAAAAYADGRSVEISYDDRGRRAHVTTTTAAGVSAADWAYDAEGRLARAGDESFSYDARGNLVRRSSPRGAVEYAYDAENHLVSWRAGLHRVDLLYDGDGRQVARVEDEVRTDLMLGASGAPLLASTGAGAPLAYIYGQERIGTEQGAQDGALRRCFLYDQPFWNVVAVAQAGGEIAASFAEAPLAEVGAPAGRSASPFVFGGAPRDSTTGLVTLDGRLYDPVFGIFINQPAALQGSGAGQAGAGGEPIAGAPASGTRLGNSLSAAPGGPTGTGMAGSREAAGHDDRNGALGSAATPVTGEAAREASPGPGSTDRAFSQVSVLQSNALATAARKRRAPPATPRPFPALTQLARSTRAPQGLVPAVSRPASSTASSTPPPLLHLHPEYLNFARSAAGLLPVSQTLEIGSTTGASLTFSITSDSPWVSLGATGGTAGALPAVLRVSVDASSLNAAGSLYTAKLTLTNTSNSSDVRSVTVRVTVSAAAVASTLRSYDASGRPERVVRPDGSITDLDYDPAGRLVDVRYPDGTSIAYTYDANGNRATMADSRGTTIYQYDVKNRLTVVANPSPGPGNIYYSYDSAGHLTGMTYPGHTITNSYDADGRLTAVVDGPATTSYTYDPSTRCVASRTLPNGVVTTYTCDADGRLTDVIHRDAKGNLIESFHYTLDAVGRRTAAAHATAAGTDSTTYGYDAVGRLASVSYPGGRSATYSYDEAGNRLAWNDSQQGNTAYSYDAANELIRAGADTFQYDANGRVVRRVSAGVILSYTYNGQGLLATVSDGTNLTSYLYDGDGNRVAKVVNGVRTNYLNAASPLAVVLVEEDASYGPVRSYTYGLERIGASRTNNGAQQFFLAGSPFDSVSRVVDATASTVASYVYDPYGEQLQPPTGLDNPYTFDAEQNDPETGLVYLRCRYYDPSTGRFLTQDPDPGNAANPGSFNPYPFAHDDPVNYIDPAGSDAWGITLNVGVFLRLFGIRGQLRRPGWEGGLNIERVEGYGYGVYFVVPDPVVGPVSAADLAIGKSPDLTIGSLKLPVSASLTANYASGHGPWSGPFWNASAGLDGVSGGYSWNASYREGQLGVGTPGASVSRTNYKLWFGSSEGSSVTRFLDFFFGSDTPDPPPPPPPPSPAAPAGGSIDDSSSFGEFDPFGSSGLGDLGGVSLSTTANLLLQLQDVTGATYDQSTGQLVILGKQNVSLPQMNLDDLAVAVHSEYGGADPGVSIEPPITNGQMNVRFTGQTPSTSFGEIMFEADRTLKILTLGEDNVTRQPVNPPVPGYQNILQRRQALGCNGMPSTVRMWFQPQQVSLVLSGDGKSMVFDTVSMELLYESKVGDQVVSDPAAAAFAAHFTQHYDDFAQVYPIFVQLKRLAKAVAVIKWIKDNHLPIDLSFIDNHPIAFFSTPTGTPAITVSGLAAGCQISITGGVTYEPPNQYTPDNPASPVADPLRQAALASRPSEQSFTWNFQAPAGPAAGANTAVAQSFARSRRDGNTRWHETDLSAPQPGPFRVALTRWYDSFSDQPGPFGPGWHVLPFELRFPVERETFTFGASNIPFELYGSIWLADRRAGREDDFVLLGIDNNNLPIYQRSGSVELLRQQSDGTFLLTRISGTRVLFSAAGALLSITDPNGNTVTYSYDTGGRLTGIAGAGGAAITLTYNAQNLVATAADATQRQVHYTYDSGGRLVTVTDPASQTHTFAYDASGRITAAADAKGNPLLGATYDDYGRAPAATVGAAASYSSTFDQTRRTSVTKDPFGRTATLQFDDRYRPVAQSDPLGNQRAVAYDGDFGPQTLTDEKGAVTALAYDAHGNPTAVVDANGNQTRRFYDDLNRLRAVQDAAGIATGFVYDSNNNLTTAYYDVELIEDASGNLTSFNADPRNASTWTYDGSGNVVAAIDPLAHQTQSTYNPAGQPVQTTSPSGLVVAHGYDARSRLATVQSGARRVALGYDAADRVTSVTSAAGATTYGYDANGRITRTTNAAASPTAYAYDADGNVASVQDAAGKVTSYSYDVQHHLRGMALANGTSRSFEYDELGRPIVATAALGAAAPVLGLAQTRLDFGKVAIGTTIGLALQIYNLGTAPLIVSGITAPAPWSVTSSGGATVAPGGVLTVSVAFAPAAAGAAAGSLTISSNDPVQPQATVALAGAGVHKVANLRATAVATGVELDWDPFDPGSQAFAHFNVYRSANPIPGDVTGLKAIDQSLTSASAVRFVDTIAPPGTAFYYAVTPQYVSGFEETSVDPAGPVVYFAPGTDFGPIGVEVAAATAAQALSSPVLAYNSATNQYLAVFERDTNGDGSNVDVVGQLLTAAGAPVGGLIPIAVSPAQERRPAVAYSPPANQFLVVFEQAASATNKDIYGRMVSATGSAVGAAFPIIANPNDDQRPEIVYDPADDRYLVVSDYTLNGGRRVILGQLLSGAGALIGSELVVANLSVNSTTPIDTRNPRATWNSRDHEFLVAFETDTLGNGTEIDIGGVRIGLAGTVIGKVVFPLSLQSASGPISTSNPSLAYDSAHDQYMVAAQADLNGNGSAFDVFARKFSIDTASGTLSGVSGNGVVVQISNVHQETRPRVGYSPASDENVVAFETAAGGGLVEADRIRWTGSVLDLAPPVFIAFGTDLERHPNLAWNSSANEYLVGWEHTAAARPADVHVNRLGYSAPILALSPGALDFGDTQTQLQVAVANIGPGTLDWTATTLTAWLTLQPASGSSPNGSPAPLKVVVSRAGLAPGAYAGTVQVSSNGGSGAVAVSMKVDAAPPDAPSQPNPADGSLAQGVAAAAGAGLTLSWQDHDSAGYALRYDIYLSTDSGRVAAHDPGVRIQQALAAPSVQVAGLAFQAIYSWCVVASDGHGNVTPGPVWSFTTIGLAAPQLVAVSPSPTNNTRPVLTWLVVAGAASYQIQVAADAAFTTILASAAGLGATSFTPSSALPQGTLYWRVRGVDTFGQPGPYSASSSFQILTTPPAVPRLIPVAPDPTNNAQPRLAWTAVTGATSYRVQVASGSAFAVPLLDVTASATSFTPLAPLPEGVVSWRAASLDAAGNQSAFSTPSSFTLVLTPPPPISGLAAQRTTSGVVLSWSAPATVPPYFDHYNVYRATASFSNVAGMAALDSSIHNSLTMTFTDLGATAGTAYYYAVTAVDTLGNENRAVAAVAAPAYVLPGVPQNPVPANGASGQAGPVTLGWQATSADGGPLTYDVYLSSQAALVSALDLSTRVATGLSTAAASASGLDYLTAYWWRVVAFNAHGGSTPGPLWSFTTAPIPAPVPIAYTPNPTNNARPTLTWMPVPLANAYGIQIDLAGTFSSPVVSVDGIAGPSFTPATPLPEGTVYWRVRGFDSHARPGAYSAASSFQLILTPPPAVTGLTAAWMAGKVHLGWSPVPASVTAFDHYSVYRAAAPFSSIAGMTPLATGVLVTTYVDGTAAIGSTYSYAVTAVDKAGNENPAVISVAPPSAASFYTVTPCRLVDTRNPNGPYGGPALAAGSLRSFALAGLCGIPASARAVSLNITITDPTAGGDLGVFPGGITPPLTSAISFSAGQTRANNAVGGVAGDGMATVSVRNDMPSGTVQLIVDVNGYFQ